MLFVIGSEKMQKIAKPNARQMVFCFDRATGLPGNAR
jgi:hypothetical protein